MVSSERDDGASSSRTARDGLPSQRAKASLPSLFSKTTARERQDAEQSTRPIITCGETVHEAAKISESSQGGTQAGESSADRRGGQPGSRKANVPGLEHPNGVNPTATSHASISFERTTWQASTTVGSRQRPISEAELRLGSLKARFEALKEERKRPSSRSTLNAGVTRSEAESTTVGSRLEPISEAEMDLRLASARARVEALKEKKKRPSSRSTLHTGVARSKAEALDTDCQRAAITQERCPCIECYVENNVEQRDAVMTGSSLPNTVNQLTRTSTIQSKAKTAARRAHGSIFTFSTNSLTTPALKVPDGQDQQDISIAAPERPKSTKTSRYELSGTAMASSSGGESSSGSRNQPAKLTFFNDIATGPNEPLSEPSEPKSVNQKGKQPDTEDRQATGEKATALLWTSVRTSESHGPSHVEAERKSPKALGKSPEPSPKTDTLWSPSEKQRPAKSEEKRSVRNLLPEPEELPTNPIAPRKPSFLEAKLRDAIATLKKGSTSEDCDPKLDSMRDELELLLAEPDSRPAHLDRLCELFTEMYVRHSEGSDWVELSGFDVVSVMSVELVSDIDDIEDSYEFV